MVNVDWLQGYSAAMIKDQHDGTPASEQGGSGCVATRVRLSDAVDSSAADVRSDGESQNCSR